MVRHRLVTLAVALTTVLGMVAGVAPGPAQATTAGTRLSAGPAHIHPDVGWGPVRFFVHGHNRCIQTHGVGNQLTIVDPAGNFCARISGTFLYIDNNTGFEVYNMHDGNGNCLANDFERVVVRSGCSNDKNQSWELAFGFPCPTCGSSVWNNEGDGGLLNVAAANVGDKVWAGPCCGAGGFADWDALSP